MKILFFSLLAMLEFFKATYAADVSLYQSSTDIKRFSSQANELSESVQNELIDHLKQYRHLTMTALMIKCIEDLILRVDDESEIFDEVATYQASPLGYSIQFRLFETAHALARRGQSFTETSPTRVDPLTTAVRVFTLEQFKKLFQIAQTQGVHINYVSPANESLLSSAIYHDTFPSPVKGQSSTLWLLNNGAIATANDLREALFRDANENIISRIKETLTEAQIHKAETDAKAKAREVERIMKETENGMDFDFPINPDHD